MNRLNKLDSVCDNSLIDQQQFPVAIPKRQRGRPRKLDNILQAKMLNKKTKTVLLANKQVFKKRGRKPKRLIESNRNSNDSDKICTELNTQLMPHEKNHADAEVVESACTLNSDQHLEKNINGMQEIYDEDRQPKGSSKEINYNSTTINDVKDSLNDKDNQENSLQIIYPDIPKCLAEDQIISNSVEQRNIKEISKDNNKDKKSAEIFTKENYSNDQSSSLNYNKQNCSLRSKNSSAVEVETEKELSNELIANNINIESDDKNCDEVSTSEEKLQIVSDGGQETNEKHTQDTQEETATKLNSLEKPIKTKNAAVTAKSKKYISLEEIGIKVRPFKGHLSSFRIPKLSKDADQVGHNSWKLESYVELDKEKHEQKVKEVKQEIEKKNIQNSQNKSEIMANYFNQKNSLSSYRIPKIKKDNDNRKDNSKELEANERKSKNEIKDLDIIKAKTLNKTRNTNSTDGIKNNEKVKISLETSNTVYKEISEKSKKLNRIIYKNQTTNETYAQVKTHKRKLFSTESYNQHDSDYNKSQTDTFEILCKESEKHKVKPIQQRRKSLPQKILDTSSDEEEITEARKVDQSLPIKTQKKPTNIHRKILDSSSSEDEVGNTSVDTLNLNEKSLCIKSKITESILTDDLLTQQPQSDAKQLSNNVIKHYKNKDNLELEVPAKAKKTFKECRKSMFDETAILVERSAENLITEHDRKSENSLKTHRKSMFVESIPAEELKNSAASVNNDKNTELTNFPNKISNSLRTCRKSILIESISSNVNATLKTNLASNVQDAKLCDLKTTKLKKRRLKDKLECEVSVNDINKTTEINGKQISKEKKAVFKPATEEIALQEVESKPNEINLEVETNIEINKGLKHDSLNSFENISNNKADYLNECANNEINNTDALEENNKKDINDSKHSGLDSDSSMDLIKIRRKSANPKYIFDSSSEDNEPIMKKPCVIAAVPAKETPLQATKKTRTKLRKKRIVRVLSTSIDAQNNSTNSSLQSDNITQPSPFTSPPFNHPIFNTDVSTPSYEFGSSVNLATLQQDDKKFKDIDSKMHEIFQSPQYNIQHTGSIDSTNSSILRNSLNDTECKNVMVEETLNTNEDNVDNSASNTELNNRTTTEHNCSEIKHLSLGTAEYRFEKVSENVVNLFISRKRKRKRNN